VSEREAGDLRSQFDVKPGDIYNARTVGAAVRRLTTRSGGALTAEKAVIEKKDGGRVLVVPLKWRRQDTNLGTGQVREDLFSPVDGFNPSIAVNTTIFDRRRFNHTLIDGTVSYKFAGEHPGFSAGFERPIFSSPKLFLGADGHDLTTSDDEWRLSDLEQSIVSFTFKNSFRDYYRRRGFQIFSVLQAGVHNELSAALRWDVHEPLDNQTDFSLFRDDASYRPNLDIVHQDVNAVVVGYRFDTRALSGAGNVQTYRRHLGDNLFGYGVSREPGLRLEWTSELAGSVLGSDTSFGRHILNTRGYLALSRRQLVSGRALVGFSSGTLPPEREFAIGGIGSVHGYAFKDARGTGMALFNAEYNFDLIPHRYPSGALLSVFGFYDAGKIGGALQGSRSDWLNGVGFGLAAGGWLRVEFGFRADAIPSSRQILVRIGPSF